MSLDYMFRRDFVIIRPHLFSHEHKQKISKYFNIRDNFFGV
jgi:hypothetical protein